MYRNDRHTPATTAAPPDSAHRKASCTVRGYRPFLLLTACCVNGTVGANTTVLGPSGGFDFQFLESLQSARYEYSTGDALIANISAGGSIGRIVGGKNVTVIPAINLGFITTPAVTADTRSGLKLSANIDAHAGVVLNAGLELGGGQLNADFAIGPTLTLPGEIRSGTFFRPVGQNFVSGGDLTLDLGLPSLDLGMDVVIGGSARGKVEYGAYPLLGYNVGSFNFNMPNINLPVFDLGLDFNLPRLPDFSFLDIPNLIPPSGQDDALYRKKLPAIDPFAPAGPGPLLSAGEVVLVNPLSSMSTTQRTEGGALVTTSTGDLMRLGLDIDGLISYAVSGVSFTGLQIDVKPGTVTLATVGYDLIDVKYGLELGYEFENRLDTWLEADFAFVDPLTGDPVDVLLRNGSDVQLTSSYSGRFDQLPEIALLSAADVRIDIDFNALKRSFNQKGSLTLGDYMELQLLSAKASAAGGLVSVELGPLYYQKFELAGEFAALEIYDTTVMLSDFGIASGLFGGSVLLEATPSNDAYLGGARGDTASGVLALSQFTLLATHDSAATSPSQDVVIAIAKRVDGIDSDADVRSRADLQGVTYRFQDSANHSYAGLYLPAGAGIELDDRREEIDVTLTLNSIENDGLIRGTPLFDENGSIRFFSPDASGALLVRGVGEIRFGRSGGLSAGTLINGLGHTISFDHNTLPDASRERGRVLTGNQRIVNQGTIRARFGGVLTPTTPEFDNEVSGVLRAESGSRINLAARILNRGLVEAADSGASIGVTTREIFGSLEGPAGRFAARDGGALEFTGVAVSGGREFTLHRTLDFITGDGATTTFHDRIDLSGSDVRLITEVGGTLRLNGLFRNFADDQIEIVNAGTLEILSGTTSLRPSGPLCSGSSCPRDPPAPTIRPVDLVNTGIVRVHGGALFAFDVDIVDYAGGGASLAGGTWELIGQSGSFSNLTKPTQDTVTAIIDVRVSEVFGNAARFADLAFDEALDPDTGETVAVSSDISTLDTRLVYNDADVLLSGRASFRYFNTVEINRGRLRLAQGQFFDTAGTFENRGGETWVDTNAALNVNGALIVNGGLVRIGDVFDVDTTTSVLRVAGADVVQPDGALARRDIEVNGGTLRIAERGRLIGIDGDLLGKSADGGHVLRAGRSWIVRDQVTIDDDGNETVAPGLIDFSEYRAGFGPDDVAEVHRNEADVRIEGVQARFLGLETLRTNAGSLTLTSGNVFSLAGPARFENLAGAILVLESAQFGGAGRELDNAGTVLLDRDSFLRLDTYRGRSGQTSPSSLDLHGVLVSDQAVIVEGNGGADDSVLRIGGGRIIAPGIDLAGLLELGLDDADGALEVGISGSGRVRKIGNGVFRLDRESDYGGGTEIAGGTLDVVSGAALGSSGGGVTFSGGNLRISGMDDGAVAHQLHFATGTAVIDIVDAQSLFEVGGGTTTAVATSLTKHGAGTVNLRGGLDLGRGSLVAMAGTLDFFGNSVALHGAAGFDGAAGQMGGTGSGGGNVSVAGGTLLRGGMQARGGRGGHGGHGNSSNSNGRNGGFGGIGGTLAVSAGLYRTTGIDLRGGDGGRGGDGIRPNIFASLGDGGEGGRGGAGGNVFLNGGELVFDTGIIDLRGGLGGLGGDGGRRGFSGQSGFDGWLRIRGGQLTTSGALLDGGLRGNLAFEFGTLRFTDDWFDLGQSSRLNQVLGTSKKTLFGNRELRFDDTLAIGAGHSLSLFSGGTLRAATLDTTAGGNFVLGAGGVLAVETFRGDLLQQGGTLAPGNSPGLTVIEGDYTLDSGTLAIEIAGLGRGTAYDAVDVTGTATLGGTLAIQLIDDFLPASGDVFELLAAETIIGTFDLLTLALLPAGLFWDIAYVLDPLGTDFVTLQAAPIPVPPALVLMALPLWFLGRRASRDACEN